MENKTYTEQEYEFLNQCPDVKFIEYNLDLIMEIRKLIKTTPNDQELGSKIRSLIKFGDNK